MCSFISLFTYSFTHSSIHSLSQSFTHLFIHSFIHSFSHSSIHDSFIHPFNHSFIHSLASNHLVSNHCKHSLTACFIHAVQFQDSREGHSSLHTVTIEGCTRKPNSPASPSSLTISWVTTCGSGTAIWRRRRPRLFHIGIVPSGLPCTFGHLICWPRLGLSRTHVSLADGNGFKVKRAIRLSTLVWSLIAPVTKPLAKVTWP